jgi:hypothetical protein
MKLVGDQTAMHNLGAVFEMRRPPWHFLCWLLALTAICATAFAQSPTTTTVSDTVFRADGTPAAGTLLVSWPAFTTANGAAVAAGTNSVTLGSGGALSVALISNAGATPAGTVYTIVYQLTDGTVKTEFWIVPTSSPATLAGVRTTLGSGASATSLASKQYVDTSVATKAIDAAVVHKTGSETIAGVKQFSTPPSVPTPAQATDAANKAYVDTAVSGVGGGSFVSKSGDAMSGPLQLNADPTAPNQAADRHYVDTGLAGKADLTSGVVPPAELATGTAGSTVCLKGNSTWGACGSSSDAISIQSVPVDTVAPSDNQVITYDATSGKYKPKAGGGVTAGMQAIKYAVDFAWSQSPTADLSTPGAKTVTLTACPAGVKAAEPQYYVYVAGTGTFEAVQVTGGTCSGNGASGTLQFTTLNAHSSGYTINSASGGLQEALIASRIVPTNPTAAPQAGEVIVPPGEFKVFARVSIRSGDITVDFSGSIVECQTTDTCIFVGDPSNSTAFTDITLISPRGRPTVANGQAPFVEVNAQKTRIFNLATRTPLSGGTFGTLVQVDDDQAFLLDGLSTSIGGPGVRCDATVCNPVIYAPGPFNVFSAVGWLKNLNLSLNCIGNGVDWQSGNTVQISDSVIQGYPQYGVRAGTKRGGFGGFSLDNVYEEVGSCSNPSGNIGQAGVIAQGSGAFGVTIKAGAGPAGVVPQFANTGTTDYRYYLVARHATFGPSNPLYAGNALSNGSGNITVTTPDIAGASSFDLLRVSVVPNVLNQAPFGSGNYGVVTSISRSSACANGVCTFTDTQASLQSYTVAAPTYFPLLDFWPGALVLGTASDSNTVSAPARAFLDNAFDNIVSVLGTVGPAVFASRCGPTSRWTPLWMECFAAESPSNFHEQGSMLLLVKPNADGGGQLNLKGRLNFAQLGSGPGHIMTLSDANFQKTIATANNRPANDANDSFIGYDQANGDPTQVGISFGASKSLSNYIGNVGNGTNWLERLTASLKEFKTTVQMDSNLTLAGTVQTTGPWTLEGVFGTMTVAGTGKSKLGFGASGKLQVSENGGTVFEVAKLDASGNVSANANTATQLAVTPSQCNGSFATGIQANGNANCSTPDIMQLAETTPPSGLANFGLFWFDSTCHCPKVISNNGQAVQLGLLNVFNADANTIEEYNGTNPQTLNFYGTRTDASNYERLRLAYDTTDGYFQMGPEAAGTGAQRGLGFWLQGSLRWVIDSGFNLKPWSDNVKDIGTPTLRPKHLYAGTYVDMTSGAAVMDLANEGTTGTTLNKLAKLTGAPATAIIAATSDTKGIVGIVVDGAGTTSNAQIAKDGQALCVFDGATTAGDYVQISSTTAGDCHDAGASYPASGQVLGRVLSTNASTGTFAILVSGVEIQAPATAAATLSSGTYLVGNGTSSVNVSSHLFDNGSNAFDLRNGTNVQTLYTYGTFTDASNYERLAQGYVSGDGYFEVLAQKAGTGTQRGLALGGTGSAGWAIDTTNVLKPFTDNSKDIGTATLRPRDVYVARNLIMSSVASTYNGRTTAGPGLVALYGSPVSSTGNTAAVSSTTLCSTTACPAGQYVVDYYVDSTVSCSSAGPAAVSVTLGWTDETNGKTQQASLTGSGISGGNSMTLGNTTSFGSGSLTLWSAGTAAITYSTSYTACTTGTATYALRMAVRQVQ